MWELCVPCLQDTLIAVNGESSIGLGFDKAFAMIAGAGPLTFSHRFHVPCCLLQSKKWLAHGT
jgi:hypothetical protein